jgi:hypothetical protein
VRRARKPKRRNPVAKALGRLRPKVKPARRRPAPEAGEWNDVSVADKPKAPPDG